MKFVMCYACKKLWCASKQCESPKCRLTCMEHVNFRDLKLDFCGGCRLVMNESFERQFYRKQIPKRIRVEERRDEEPPCDQDDDEAAR